MYCFGGTGIFGFAEVGDGAGLASCWTFEVGTGLGEARAGAGDGEAGGWLLEGGEFGRAGEEADGVPLCFGLMSIGRAGAGAGD